APARLGDFCIAQFQATWAPAAASTVGHIASGAVCFILATTLPTSRTAAAVWAGEKRGIENGKAARTFDEYFVDRHRPAWTRWHYERECESCSAVNERADLYSGLLPRVFR